MELLVRCVCGRVKIGWEEPSVVLLRVRVVTRGEVGAVCVCVRVCVCVCACDCACVRVRACVR